MDERRKSEEKIGNIVEGIEERLAGGSYERIQEIIRRSSNGEKARIIANDLKVSLAYVCKIRKKNGIYGENQVTELIKQGKSNEEIEQKSKWNRKTIEEFREKLSQKKSPTEKDILFRTILAQSESRMEVAKILGYKEISSVSRRKERLQALNRKEIIALLNEIQDDAEIARRAQLPDVSVITRIRQEEDEKRKQKQASKTLKRDEKTQLNRQEIDANSTDNLNRTQKNSKCDVKNLSPEQEEEFLKMATILTSVNKMADRLGLSSEEIRELLRDYNIFEKSEVIQWLAVRSSVQIAIMGNLKDYTIVDKVKKEGHRVELITDEKSLQSQKQREEEAFDRMARNYEKIEKIASVFAISNYEVLLKLRRKNILSRDELKRKIEEGTLSDEELAGKEGNSNAVKRIRREIERRERLIASISEKDQKTITTMLGSRKPASLIAKRMRVSVETIKAIEDKWNRDKNYNMSEKQRKVNFTREFLDFRCQFFEKMLVEQAQRRVNYSIAKLIIEYGEFLTLQHYAYMAYSYIKVGKYVQALEFAQEYMGLEMFSASALQEKLNEILEEKEDGQGIKRTVAISDRAERDSL